jgi:hypothetical protein
MVQLYIQIQEFFHMVFQKNILLIKILTIFSYKLLIMGIPYPPELILFLLKKDLQEQMEQD